MLNTLQNIFLPLYDILNGTRPTQFYGNVELEWMRAYEGADVGELERQLKDLFEDFGA